MKCAECGHENLSTTKYCTRCGQTLGAAAPTSGGQVRKTIGVDSAFDAPMPPPLPQSGGFGAPPMAARPATGQARRTILEEGPGQAPDPQAPAGRPITGAQGGPPSGSRRTILDEGPSYAPAGGAGAPAQAVASPGTARVVGWIVSYDRNAAGQHYAIHAGKNTIGRGRDNDISIFFEPRASDFHATILWKSGQVAVTDANSTNGTIVNGEDIGIGATRTLQSGDTLTVGNSTFLVFLVEGRLAARLWPQSPWAV
jgi:hypothetical protein